MASKPTRKPSKASASRTVAPIASGDYAVVEGSTAVRSAPGTVDGSNNLQLRQTADGTRLVGYAVVYNSPSRPIAGNNGSSFIES